mmetsp:Transcript_13298/g.31914  ORF Transcript_13298/g.31914 Transcript_13298/m.31914 type:complete len:81 (+) Transcript_13298:725-967(+)
MTASLEVSLKLVRKYDWVSKRCDKIYGRREKAYIVRLHNCATCVMVLLTYAAEYAFAPNTFTSLALEQGVLYTSIDNEIT